MNINNSFYMYRQYIVFKCKNISKMGHTYGNIEKKNLSSQQAHNVETTSIQRQDIESTLNRPCINVVCLLGFCLISDRCDH